MLKRCSKSIVTYKRLFSHQHFIDDNAKAIQVCTTIHLLCQGLLRTHVFWSADRKPSLSQTSRPAVNRLGNPKIR